MNKETINKLLQAYLDGTATPEERKIVDTHFLHYLDRMASTPSQQQLDDSFAKTYQQIHRNLHPTPRTKSLWMRALPYAAALLLISGLAGVFLFDDDTPTSSQQVAERDSVVPGSHRAILTLDNGATLQLSESHTGIVMDQGQITYSDGSRLADQPDARAGKHYTLQTPRGGTYHVRLPDGTDVWLNADSRMRYGADFGQSARREVHLEGEAYFEVAKDTAPFLVMTPREQIEVLGTHFNVYSYPTEHSARTTLVEGSVRINRHTVLQPGQQAVVDPSGRLHVTIVDTEQAIAWKNGKFVFESEGLESVMQKIGRWYDVDVQYSGSVSNKTFNGTISRFENIETVLQMINYTSNVEFQRAGRRITVMP